MTQKWIVVNNTIRVMGSSSSSTYWHGSEYISVRKKKNFFSLTDYELKTHTNIKLNEYSDVKSKIPNGFQTANKIYRKKKHFQDFLF